MRRSASHGELVGLLLSEEAFLTIPMLGFKWLTNPDTEPIQNMHIAMGFTDIQACFFIFIFYEQLTS